MSIKQPYLKLDDYSTMHLLTRKKDGYSKHQIRYLFVPSVVLNITVISDLTGAEETIKLEYNNVYYTLFGSYSKKIMKYIKCPNSIVKIEKLLDISNIEMISEPEAYPTIDMLKTDIYETIWQEIRYINLYGGRVTNVSDNRLEIDMIRSFV